MSGVCGRAGCTGKLQAELDEQWQATGRMVCVACGLDAGLDERPQHLAGLDRANQFRFAHALLRRRITQGDCDLPALFLDPDQLPYTDTMSVYMLVISQHQWGRSRTLTALRKAGVGENIKRGALTHRQRTALAQELS